MSDELQNPFRASGIVDHEFFTDREDELRRVEAALRTPAAKLLVYGHRRMGKSSVLARAVRRRREARGHAFIADLSTASTVTDMGNRIMEGAVKTLGRSWRDLASDLATRLGGRITLTPDAASGAMVPSFEVGLRRAAVEEQRESLTRVLDAIDDLARARKRTVGVVLDEFQEIARFGGEDAEWHLRGAIQHHQHVSYVLAGSRPHLIRRMLEQGRAFYDMLDVLPFGAIDPVHLAGWIEQRMEAADVAAEGAGERIVAVAGPRTRDVVQLAARTFERAAAERRVLATHVDHAFRELVDDRDDLVRAYWGELTANQQNVLRAVAVQPTGLTTADSLERFGFTNSSAVSQALAAFVEEGRLVRDDATGGYLFDSPFLRGWVIVNALPDIGVALPATHPVPSVLERRVTAQAQNSARTPTTICPS